MISKKITLLLLVGCAVLLAILGLLTGPIPQSQSYHNFADQRPWLGVVNAWNVLSNIAFAVVGFWGLFLLYTPQKIHFKDERERLFWVVIAIGMILTGVGSAYYHWSPNDARLVWDRLPMTLVFMSFVAALIAERINMSLGLWLWPFLLIVGFSSVLLWHSSEVSGHGDLRFYINVQLFTLLAMGIMLLAHSPYTRSRDLALVILFYVLAKFFELFDLQTYEFTHEIISGHTLKHIFSAMAGACLIYMIWKRREVKP